jgi:hypothetical protein
MIAWFADSTRLFTPPSLDSRTLELANRSAFQRPGPVYLSIPAPARMDSSQIPPASRIDHGKMLSPREPLADSYDSAATYLPDGNLRRILKFALGRDSV